MKENFLYNVLLTGSSLLFPLITFPYLTRTLSVEGLGISNFILSYCQNFIVIAALGLSVYGIREVARVGDNKIKRSKLFFELLIIHLLFTGLVLIGYLVSVFFYKDFMEYKLITFAGGIFILVNAFTIEWLFSGVSDFKFITLRSIFIKLIALLAIFLFVREKKDFDIYFIIYVTQFLITAILNLVYAKKYITTKVNITAKEIRLHLKPLSTLGAYIILTSIYAIMPNTLLGFLSSYSAVGYLYSADKIIRVIISLFSALSMVMIPKLNELVAKDDTASYKALIEKSMSFVINFGVPLTVFVFLFARSFTMVLAGKEFVSSISCIRIMSPIVLIVASAQVFCIQILSVHRRDRAMVKLAFIGMCTSIIINLIFIPLYAQNAAAVSQLLSELTVTMASVFFVRKVVDFSFPLKQFIYNLICVLPFGFIAYVVYNITDNDLFVLLLAGVFCGVYFIMYQFLVLKDKSLIGFVEPFLLRLRGARAVE